MTLISDIRRPIQKMALVTVFHHQLPCLSNRKKKQNFKRMEEKGRFNLSVSSQLPSGMVGRLGTE